MWNKLIEWVARHLVTNETAISTEESMRDPAVDPAIGPYDVFKRLATAYVELNYRPPAPPPTNVRKWCEEDIENWKKDRMRPIGDSCVKWDGHYSGDYYVE